MDVVILIIILAIILSLIGDILGKFRASRKLKKEIKKVKLENPYLYFRDIPNDYGIGVYAFLLDYKLNKRDFKAALIDLSAKGYLKLLATNNSLRIELTSKDNTNLLKNEKYILNWLNENSNIKKFKISEWKKYIIEDILDLKIGEKRKMKELDDDKYTKLHKVLTITSLFLITAVLAVLFIIVYIGKPIDVFSIIIFLVLVPIISFFPVYLIIGLIMVLFSSFDIASYYKLSKSLKYTEKTKDVIRTIYALGAFIKDFSLFADRNINEIIIWERYFSYAYLLGLNDSLDLKYSKIYNNEHFKIDITTLNNSNELLKN